MLDKVLEEGLDKENLKHKDKIVASFIAVKDKVRIEDFFF
jgi:hypothetical protein